MDFWNFFYKLIKKTGTKRYKDEYGAKVDEIWKRGIVCHRKIIAYYRREKVCSVQREFFDEKGNLLEDILEKYNHKKELIYSHQTKYNKSGRPISMIETGYKDGKPAFSVETFLSGERRGVKIHKSYDENGQAFVVNRSANALSDKQKDKERIKAQNRRARRFIKAYRQNVQEGEKLSVTRDDVVRTVRDIRKEARACLR